VFHKDTRQVYRHAALDGFAGWLDYGFGTRFSVGWPPSPLASLRQVHSSACIAADGRTGVLGEGDALITTTPGVYIGVRTADCPPILIVDPRRRAVAAVHAGWRGTAAQVAVRTVEKLREIAGSRPEDLVAIIGPGICGQCYQVGPEVAMEFRPWFPERTDLEGRTLLDLAEANRRQLIAAGVAGSRIHAGAPCTACGGEEFFSHRARPANAGRMVSAAGLVA
jgi:YfiH family protein